MEIIFGRSLPLLIHFVYCILYIKFFFSFFDSLYIYLISFFYLNRSLIFFLTFVPNLSSSFNPFEGDIRIWNTRLKQEILRVQVYSIQEFIFLVNLINFCLFCSLFLSHLRSYLLTSLLSTFASLSFCDAPCFLIKLLCITKSVTPFNCMGDLNENERYRI